MKRFILFAFLISTFGLFNHAQAQYRNPDLAWGLSVGAAHGSDIGIGFVAAQQNIHGFLPATGFFNQ